jgi:nitrite reductase (NADH) large subunit
MSDAALLHVAKAQQLAARRGLDVELVAESSWANIRDKLVAGRFGAAHLLEGDHMSEPLVVVGNGMAATRFVDELMQRALGRYSVIVIGAEPRLSYNRVLLSSLLAGEVSESAIELKPRGWWNRYGVTTLNGQAVASIDRRGRVVTLADGQCFTFSKLVLATGSHPVRLPKPGMDLQNVLTFRDLADVSAMRALMRQGARAAVIGGGLLGIEAAYGLAKAGVKVALVHLMDRLMERQLDERAALLLKRAIEAEGIEVLLGADTKRVLGEDRATGLELSDARVVPADFVVCAVDIRPNAELAREAGLAVNGGILVDDGLTTSDPNVFALGECAEHRGCVSGLVEPANEQARILACRLAGDRTVAYLGSTLAANLRVSGVNVFSAGEFIEAPGSDVITLEDEGALSYKKLVMRDGRLTGAVLFGDTADGLWYLNLIRSGADVSHWRDILAFGPALALPQAA